MAFLSNPKILVIVVVYTRLNNIRRWLRAWQYCQRYDAKLAVIHNYDGPEPNPEFSRFCNQFRDKADYYIPRRNVGMDMGAFQDICYRKLEVPFSWDILYWSADDTIPMRQDFLLYFIHQVMSEGVGACGPQISDEVQRHLRTNCFCIKRKVAEKLIFPVDKIESRHQCYEFEHIKNTMTNQIENMGLKVTMPDNSEANGNVSFATWDTGHYAHLDLWDRYFKEFPACLEFGKGS